LPAQGTSSMQTAWRWWSIASANKIPRCWVKNLGGSEGD